MPDGPDARWAGRRSDSIDRPLIFLLFKKNKKGISADISKPDDRLKLRKAEKFLPVERADLLSCKQYDTNSLAVRIFPRWCGREGSFSLFSFEPPRRYVLEAFLVFCFAIV
jgi:hypothetical protein